MRRTGGAGCSVLGTKVTQNIEDWHLIQHSLVGEGPHGWAAVFHLLRRVTGTNTGPSR